MSLGLSLLRNQLVSRLRTGRTPMIPGEQASGHWCREAGRCDRNISLLSQSQPSLGSSPYTMTQLEFMGTEERWTEGVPEKL